MAQPDEKKSRELAEIPGSGVDRNLRIVYDSMNTAIHNVYTEYTRSLEPPGQLKMTITYPKCSSLSVYRTFKDAEMQTTPDNLDETDSNFEMLYNEGTPDDTSISTHRIEANSEVDITPGEDEEKSRGSNSSSQLDSEANSEDRIPKASEREETSEKETRTGQISSECERNATHDKGRETEDGDEENGDEDEDHTTIREDEGTDKKRSEKDDDLAKYDEMNNDSQKFDGDYNSNDGLQKTDCVNSEQKAEDGMSSDPTDQERTAAAATAIITSKLDKSEDGWQDERDAKTGNKDDRNPERKDRNTGESDRGPVKVGDKEDGIPKLAAAGKADNNEKEINKERSDYDKIENVDGIHTTNNTTENEVESGSKIEASHALKEESNTAVDVCIGDGNANDHGVDAKEVPHTREDGVVGVDKESNLDLLNNHECNSSQLDNEANSEISSSKSPEPQEPSKKETWTGRISSECKRKETHDKGRESEDGDEENGNEDEDHTTRREDEGTDNKRSKKDDDLAKYDEMNNDSQKSDGDYNSNDGLQKTDCVNSEQKAEDGMSSDPTDQERTAAAATSLATTQPIEKGHKKEDGAVEQDEINRDNYLKGKDSEDNPTDCSENESGEESSDRGTTRTNDYMHNNSATHELECGTAGKQGDQSVISEALDSGRKISANENISTHDSSNKGNDQVEENSGREIINCNVLNIDRRTDVKRLTDGTESAKKIESTALDVDESESSVAVKLECNNEVGVTGYRGSISNNALQSGSETTYSTIDNQAEIEDRSEVEYVFSVVTKRVGNFTVTLNKRDNRPVILKVLGLDDKDRSDVGIQTECCFATEELGIQSRQGSLVQTCHRHGKKTTPSTDRTIPVVETGGTGKQTTSSWSNSDDVDSKEKEHATKKLLKQHRRKYWKTLEEAAANMALCQKQPLSDSEF